MKYIKTFEKYDPDKLRLFLDDLEEFCKESLSFLTDLGPRLDIDSSYGRNILPRQIDDEIEAKVEMVFMCLNGRWDFNWSDIKDYIIPFMIRLNKNYQIKLIEVCGRQSKFNPEKNLYFGVDFTKNFDDINTIVNDKLEDDLLIMTIKVEIKTNIGEKSVMTKLANFNDKINQVATKVTDKLNKFLNDKI